MKFESKDTNLALLANVITVVGGVAATFVLPHALGATVLIVTAIIFLALRQK